MQIRHLLNFILLLLFLTSWLRADVASARNALLQGDLTAAAAALSGQASSAEVQILHSLLDIAQWFEGDLPPLAALIGADAAAAATFTDLSANSNDNDPRVRHPIYGKSQPLAYSESSGITTYEFVDQDSILALYNSSDIVKTVAIDVTFAEGDYGNQSSSSIEIYANGEWSGYVDMYGQSFSYNYNDWYDGTYQKSFTITIQPGEHVRFQGTSTYYDPTIVAGTTSLSFSTADVEIQNGDYWRYDWVQSFEDELFDFELIQEAPGSLWGKDGSLVTDGPVGPVGPGYSVGLDYFITNEDLFYNGYPSRSISLQYNGTAARQVDLEFYINTNSDFKGRVCINGLDVGELRPFGFYLDGDSTWVSANYVQSSSAQSYTLGLWMEQGDQLSIEMEPEYMDSISQEVATDPIFGFNLDSDRDLLVSNGIAYTDAYPKFASNTTSETFANFFMRKGGSFGQLLNTLIARIEKIKQGDRAVFEPNETGLSERVVIEHTDAQILLAFLKFTRGLQLVVDMYGSGNIDLSYANYLNYLVDPVAIWDDYPNLMKLVASRRSQGAQAKQLFKQALQHYRNVESNLWTRQSALTESYLFEVSTSSEPMDRLDFNDRLSVFETSLSRTVILNQDDPLAPKDLGFSLKPLFSTSPVDLRAVMPQFDERGIYAGTSESLLTAGFTQGIDISKLEQSLADDELLYTPEWGELYDDFSGSELDTQKWDTWYMQGGLGPTVEAGELKLSISPGNPSVKVIPIEELQSAFIDGTDNSGVTFADPSIIGVEADLRLPADVPLESGVFIDSVSSSRSKVKTAGIELAYRPTGPKLDIEIGGIDKGSQPASLDQTYRVRLTHINGKMQIFIDGSLVLNSSVSGEFLGFIIGAFNDAGQSMTATVDNVRVLRARDTLKVQVSLAQGIIADSDGDATVSIQGDFIGEESYAVSLVRGKGTLQVAMPTGSTYTVSASLGEALTSGDPRSVLMNKAATVSLVLDGDSDEDGLPDSLEARYKGKADNPDTDGDGIPDGAEVNTYRTRVDVADTDKDGLDDYEEINTTFTNPLKADSDGDRMSDYAELQAGTDPTDKSVYPAYLKVQVSLAKGIIADSDGDATVSIGEESYAVSLVRGKGTLQVAMPTGSTYTVSASLGEALTSGDPRSVLMNKAATVSLVLDGDSDEDGLPDSLEARYKGKADNPDTDGDGIPDGAEVNTYRTRVDVADTDKDGLDDYEEINTTFTNPLKADSDGDRMSDYAELQAGTDPTDKSVYPAYLKVQVSLAQGIIADSDGDATVSIDGEPYAVSLVRGKGTLQVAMPIGSTYTVSASLGEALTSGDPRSVLLNRAATVSLVLDGDSDEDGLPDSLEARYKGKADNPDTDGDGIPDGAEVNTYGTRVDVADTDKDGFTDKQELDLNTNPLSSKDKPEAYIQRPVLVDLNLTYESANGYIVEKWDTAEMAYFLSSAVKDPQQGASIYLKYSLDGSNLKWIVRANSVDIDVSSLMRPIKVSKPAQLDGEVLSSINPLTGDYSVTQMFSLAISAGRTKSLSLVVSGESSFSAVGPNVSGLELDLATSSDYKALGMLKDPSRSNGPILIEGTLTMGDELANVLGQIIGSVETK